MTEPKTQAGRDLLHRLRGARTLWGGREATRNILIDLVQRKVLAIEAEAAAAPAAEWKSEWMGPGGEPAAAEPPDPTHAFPACLLCGAYVDDLEAAEPCTVQREALAEALGERAAQPPPDEDEQDRRILEEAQREHAGRDWREISTSLATPAAAEPPDWNALNPDPIATYKREEMAKELDAMRAAQPPPPILGVWTVEPNVDVTAAEMEGMQAVLKDAVDKGEQIVVHNGITLRWTPVLSTEPPRGVTPALDVERLAEAMGRHADADPDPTGHWNHCASIDCAEAIAAEYNRLAGSVDE